MSKVEKRYILFRQYIKSNLSTVVLFRRFVINMFNCLLFRKKYLYFTKNKIIFLDLDEYRNTFWGYYDNSPFNPENDNLILFHANNANPFKKPNPRIKTDIVLYSIKERKVMKLIDSVYSWNWQQGCRLRWIDSDKLMYNYFDNKSNQYKSIIYDIKTDHRQLLDIPVQESYKSKYILSLSYEALNRVRPDYGYRNKNTSDLDLKKRDITYLSLKNNNIKKLISLEDIIDRFIDKKKRSIVNKPIINHILVSPNGNKFIFLFRYYLNNHRKHILFLYNLKDAKPRILIRNQVISHYTWRNNSSLIFWGKINENSDYFIININSRQIYKLNTKLPDGHPVMINGNTFVTDTYPDKSRMRKLLNINIGSKKIDLIGEFYESPFFIGETRCDLHPNVDNSINYLNVDTIFKNKRMIALIKI